MTTATYESWLMSRRFWIDTLERVVRTTAQVALAVLGAPLAVDAAGVDVKIADDWRAAVILIASTAVLTFVTCLAGRTTGDPSTASLTSGTGNELAR